MPRVGFDTAGVIEWSTATGTGIAGAAAYVLPGMTLTGLISIGVQTCSPLRDKIMKSFKTFCGN